jgi:apolipoprotein N-acyltransferase
MKLPSKEDLGFIGIVMVVVLVFFYLILGFSGMISSLGIIMIFIVPVYFILGNFDLATDEKLVFSFFISTGIFSSIAYWLGIFISFKLAIFVTFVMLLVVGFGIKKFKEVRQIKS